MFTHPKPSVHLLHSADSRGGANRLRRWSRRENCSRLRASSRCTQRAAAANSRSARRTASSREACAERASSSKAFLASSAAPAGTSAPQGGGHTRVRPPRPSSIHTSARRSIAGCCAKRLRSNAPAPGGQKRAAEARTRFYAQPPLRRVPKPRYRERRSFDPFTLTFCIKATYARVLPQSSGTGTAQRSRSLRISAARARLRDTQMPCGRG